MTRSCLTILLCIAACQAAPKVANGVDSIDTSTTPTPISDTGLLEARVPRAAAGDSGWQYNVVARADFDGDGIEERAVLIADVALDARGTPMWEHGHRWQLYLEEQDSTRTYAYAAFLPNGKATVDVAAGDSSKAPTITLLTQTPHALALYEFAYRAPGTIALLNRFERTLDPAHAFVGSPRP